MSEIENSIKLAKSRIFSSETVYEDLRGRRISDESVIYKGSYDAHLGFINKYPVAINMDIVEGHANPQFIPNDKEFYKGFLHLIKESGIPDSKLCCEIPYLALLYTHEYYRYAMSERSGKFKELFEKFKASKLKEGNYTESQLKSMYRGMAYDVLRPKGDNTSNPYVISQNSFKNANIGMCVELNSSYANLLALLGYDTYVVGGYVYVNNKRGGHAYPLMRMHDDNPYVVTDISLKCFGGEIMYPLRGYDITLKSNERSDIRYYFPSFREGSSSVQPILKK